VMSQEAELSDKQPNYIDEEIVGSSSQSHS